MTDGLDSRSRRARRRHLLPLVVVLVAVAPGAALVGAHGLGAENGGQKGAPSATSPGTIGPGVQVWPKDLVCPSERSLKVGQIEPLGYAPEVAFFDCSRSTRFEPSYLRKKTGLRGFNLAMTNGKPEDAWPIAHLLHDMSLGTKLRWIWGIQSSTIHTRPLEAGLVQDPRLNKCLPDDLLRAQGRLLRQTREEVPTASLVRDRRYAWDAFEDEARTAGLEPTAVGPLAGGLTLFELERELCQIGPSAERLPVR